MRRILRSTALLLSLAAASPARAQIVVSSATAPIAIAEDFNGFSNGEVSGILAIPGASIAEDCFGQTTTELASGFEVTAGAPANPATLAPPPAQDGVYVTVIGGAGRIAGLAQGLTIDDVGEGALTIRYEQTQQQVGLFLYGNNGAGTATFQCFASNGALIGSATVSSMPDRNLTITSNGAPIRVLTFTNADLQGLGLDDLRHSVPPPGPSAYCFGDGSGTPCPCGNAGASGNGCANSDFAAGAHLALTAGPGLQITQGVANQPVLFFRGNQTVNGGAGSAFGDGLRCAGGVVFRLAVLGMNASGSATLANLPVPPPGTNYYQGWYRDPSQGPCGTGFNLTNGIAVP